MKSTDKLFEIVQYDDLNFKLSDLQNVYLSSLLIDALGSYKDHFLNMLKAISYDAISMYGYDAEVSANFSIDHLDFSIESSNLYPHWTDQKDLQISFFEMDSSSEEDCQKALGSILNKFLKVKDNELFSDLDTFNGLFQAVKYIDNIFENRYDFFKNSLSTDFSLQNHNSKITVDIWTLQKGTKYTKAVVLSNRDFRISVTGEEFELQIKDTTLRTKTMSKSSKFLANTILNIYNNEFDTDYIQMKDFLDVLEMKLY